MFWRWLATLVISFLTPGAQPLLAGELPAGKPAGARKNVVGPRLDLYGDPLPQGAVARLGTVRFRHQSLHSVAWSPDGKMLASGGGFIRDGSIRLWQAATGREVRRIDGWAKSLAWSPDGKTLAWGWDDDDPSIYLFDVTTGKVAGQLIGHDHYGIDCLAWSPDGRMLACGGSDQTARLWDLATRNPPPDRVANGGD